MALRLTSPTERPVARSVAGVLSELEGLAPEVVDVDFIRETLTSIGDQRAEDPKHALTVIDQLRRTGWLLPLRTRGLWEFAPAARSGAFRSGDPFTELRAYLRQHPQRRAVVALESAAFRLGLARHPPAREVLAVDDSVRGDGALGGYRLVRLDLGPAAERQLDGVPVHTVEALLVSMAAKAGGYRDWPNVMQWLAEAVHAARVLLDEDTTQATPTAPMRQLLDGKNVATWARAAYLLHAGGDRQRAEQLLAVAPGRPTGPVYLGPRVGGDPDAHGRPQVWDQLTGVYDSVLRARDALQESNPPKVRS